MAFCAASEQLAPKINITAQTTPNLLLILSFLTNLFLLPSLNSSESTRQRWSIPYWKFTKDLHYTISDTNRIESLAKKNGGVRRLSRQEPQWQRHDEGI